MDVPRRGETSVVIAESQSGFRHRTVGVWNALSILVALLLALSTAQAQDVVGTVQATIDDAAEPSTWYVLRYNNDDGDVVYTAEWDTVIGGSVQIEIEAFPEPRRSIQGSLELFILTLLEPPSNCPCSYDDVEVIFHASSAVAENLFTTDEGEVTLTTFDPLGDDAFRVEGTFEATLMYEEVYAAEPDPSRTMTLVGTFVVDHLPKD